MKDFMGSEILVGSYVAYAGICGHSSFMTVGIVEAIDTAKRKLKVRRVRLSFREMSDYDAKRASSVHASNAIVIPKPLSDAEVACLDDSEEVAGSNPA